MADRMVSLGSSLGMLIMTVAVRAAVQSLLVQQRLMLRGKEHYPFPTIPCLMIGSSCEKVRGRTCDLCTRLSIGLPRAASPLDNVLFSW